MALTLKSVQRGAHHEGNVVEDQNLTYHLELENVVWSVKHTLKKLNLKHIWQQGTSAQTVAKSTACPE